MRFSLTRAVKPAFYLKTCPNVWVRHSRPPPQPQSLLATCHYIHCSLLCLSSTDFSALKAACACTALAKCFSLTGKNVPSTLQIWIPLILTSPLKLRTLPLSPPPPPPRRGMNGSTGWLSLLGELQIFLFPSKNSKLFHLFIHQIFSISMCGALCQTLGI